MSHFFHTMACERLNQLDLLVFYDEAATIKHWKIDFWNEIEIVEKIDLDNLKPCRFFRATLYITANC